MTQCCDDVATAVLGLLAEDLHCRAGSHSGEGWERGVGERSGREEWERGERGAGRVGC